MYEEDYLFLKYLQEHGYDISQFGDGTAATSMDPKELYKDDIDSTNKADVNIVTEQVIWDQNSVCVLFVFNIICLQPI